MRPIRSYSLTNVGLPSKSRRVGSCLTRFEGLLSVYSHYGLHARQVAFATLYTERLQRLRCLHHCSDCYRAERSSSRVGLAPTVDQRLSRRTYVPNVLENRSVAIGIILWDPAEVVPLNMLNI
jgi:hypothetical protein